MFPLAGVAQVPVGEDHALGIEDEIAIDIVLPREVNLVDGVRKSLLATALPEEEDTPGLPPDSENGYGESAAKVAACSAGSWKRSSLISSMCPEPGPCSFSCWYSYNAAQASMNSLERDVTEPLVTI